MTMHLERGLTTLRTKKRKKAKLTLGKIAKLEQQMREHNKYMKSIGCHNLVMNLKEYTDYCQGNYKSKAQKSVANNDFKPLKTVESYVRKTEYIPSKDSTESFAPCTRKEPQQYSGERKLLGIATMHKSNLVPVFSDDDAKELAKMRR